MLNLSNISLPEGIVLVYSMLHLLSAIALHNKPKRGRWNAPWEFISIGFWLIVLYCGGFFA